MIKYTCKHCKNTQYISELLIKLFSGMSCYVCTNPITRKDVEEQDE